MISYLETDETELDLIKDLWEKLNHHHQLRSEELPSRLFKYSF